MKQLHTQLPNVLLLLSGGALIWLYWSDRFGLYIRPDYHLFSYLMGVGLLALGYFGLSVPPDEDEHHHSNSKSRFQSLWRLFQLVAFLGLWAYLVFGPRYSLSTRAAVNRGVNLNAASGTNASDESDRGLSPLLLLSRTDAYNLADWTRLLRRDPEPTSHQGKAVQVEGFVQPNEDGTFLLARFVVSCCTVDASPIGLDVNAPASDYITNEWLRIRGKLMVVNKGTQRILVIEPENIEKIEEPAQPYLY